MQQIKPTDWKVTNWSGGTTSELYISPSIAEFKKGNYQLRISIATVEVEESTFTPLPNVDRVLTVLEGEIELIHEGHHSKVLQQYEKDSFKGDWTTKSKGKVRDFNVMTIDHSVEVEIIKISSEEIIHFQKNDFVFVADGSVVSNGLGLKKNHAVICIDELELVGVKESVLILVRHFDKLDGRA